MRKPDSSILHIDNVFKRTYYFTLNLKVKFSKFSVKSLIFSNEFRVNGQITSLAVRRLLGPWRTSHQTWPPWLVFHGSVEVRGAPSSTLQGRPKIFQTPASSTPDTPLQIASCIQCQRPFPCYAASPLNVDFHIVEILPKIRVFS